MDWETTPAKTHWFHTGATTSAEKIETVIREVKTSSTGESWTSPRDARSNLWTNQNQSQKAHAQEGNQISQLS
jgi:hypothetical protein